jgi:hypothetical protein
VSNWGQYLDDLAAAITELLHEGAAPSGPIRDVQAVLAARDAVLVELRELVGAVADVPQFGAVRELTVADAVHRPAQALHQALSGLPRAVSFGNAELPAAPEAPRRGYEHAWQRAARATLGLESYLGALGKLPDTHAWHVLRDLTDLAAAVPYLDHDLSEKIRPALHNDDNLAAAYQMLTHSGHTAVRMVAAELRARVPAGGAAHSADQPAAPARNSAPSVARTPARGAAAPPKQPPATPRALPDPERLGQIADATTRLTHAVSARGPNLSVPDLRAVTRLLEVGSTAAANALDGAAHAVDGARETATGLHTAASLARELRTVPVKAMTPPHLEVVRLAADLQSTLQSLAAGAARPGARSDLRQLAGPALEYAQHAPALAAALELSVREAVAAGLMLVPGTVSWRPDLPVTWVTAKMTGAARPGPPEIVERAVRLATSSRPIAPSARLATQDLTRQAAAGTHGGQQAAADARRRAGLARQELRAALSSRTAAGPTVLAPDLPRHPALAPPLPGQGRRH